MTKSRAYKAERRRRSRCPTKKRAFRDEIDAKLFLAIVSTNARKPKDHDLQRAYRCNLCPNWHLTHKDLRT